MQQYKTAKLVLHSLMGCFMVLGLVPHYVSLREHRFYHSKVLSLYSFIIASTFTTIYGKNMFNDLKRNQFDLKNVFKLYSYMNIVASVITYLTTLILSRIFVRLFNSVKLFEYMKYFDINGTMVVNAGKIVFLKYILIPIIYEITLIVQQVCNQPNKQLLWTFYTLLPMMISQVFPNLFFVALIICRMLMVILNERLKMIAKEVNYMQTSQQMNLHKPYYRMKQFCELADRLDVLAQKYRLICLQTTQFVQLLSVPFIYSLLCNLCGITAGFYTQYSAMADTFINNQPYDAFNVIINAVFLGIFMIEVLLQGHISDENRLTVQETGMILQRINLTHADERFKKAVEEFSLLVLAIKYKIQPLGLLEIDISLSQAVLSAVASFLLILIQTDLTLRFSLL